MIESGVLSVLLYDKIIILHHKAIEFSSMHIIGYLIDNTVIIMSGLTTTIADSAVALGYLVLYEFKTNGGKYEHIHTSIDKQNRY